MTRRIYVASSWRNEFQPELVNTLIDEGYDVYDFRNPAPGREGFSWSEIDRNWLGWDMHRFADLVTSHPIAAQGFGLDKAALDWCDTCILLLPCGKSAHLEAGYAAGQGKQVIAFLHERNFEPELMYLLLDAIVCNENDLLMYLRECPKECKYVNDWSDYIGTEVI